MGVRLTPIIIFVGRFEQCLRFYRNVLGLKPVRVYRGRKHPEWVEFQIGGTRLALHGKYSGAHFRQGRPLAVHFEVPDIQKAVKKIKQYGGKVTRGPTQYDFRPAEKQIAVSATFEDPDGNTFEVQQVLQKF
jgi:lactoylglutathione lyase